MINMLSGLRYRKQVWVIMAIVISVSVLSKCAGKKKDPGTEDLSYNAYAGADKCINCHKSIYDSHIQTAHYLTGRPADAKSVMGSFEQGKNIHAYSPELFVEMQKRDSGLFQVVNFRGEEKMAMRFDFIIGSGEMGQSYLSWRNNKLYQLPVTYYTAAGQWSNSPGFPDKGVGIDKVITSRCLECHMTYAEGAGGTILEPESFNKAKFLFGVDCEKCHGPAAQHVNFHTNNAGDTTARFIVNPSQLERTRQLDICALCHAGNITKTKPSFSFTAGKNLADYFFISELNHTAVHTGNIDVHGNQVGLLQSSMCFSKSVALTCITCHNTHEKERGRLELFSQRCIHCHPTKDASFLTTTHDKITAIEKNCIDCHMPLQSSRAIAVKIQGEETPRASVLRTHFIRIYPNETQKFINTYLK
jgi:hypothetical protein